MSSHGRPHPRKAFAVEEDIRLVRAVEDLGTGSWSVIAACLSGRNARQCRERWRNYLAPNIDNGPWTQAEEELLIVKHAELGAAWKQISAFFPFRTDINIKSRWHQIQRRWRRAHREAEPEPPAAVPKAHSNPEAIFDEIWKAHMQTEEAEAGILYAGWY
jgi:hypothetical protein